MNIQTVFQAGNSAVISLPKKMMKELNIKIGQQLIVEKLPEADAFIVRRKTKKTKKHVEAEFKQWLANFLAEDAKLLDELAVR